MRSFPAYTPPSGDFVPAPPRASRLARAPLPPPARAEVHGKFFRAAGEKLYLRGVTYGPFRPGTDGEPYDSERTREDFARIAAEGINTVRLYTPPPEWLLDTAAENGLRVLAGLAWEQHVAFLEDRRRPEAIVERVRREVSARAGHPALLAWAVGNEIPAPIVRWHGAGDMRRFLSRLHATAKEADPGALVTYVNYPSTEYLELHFLDFDCFNVFLEDPGPYEAYLHRLQNLAGERPLVLTEIGLDSGTNGEEAQAATVGWQVRDAYAAGCAGAFVFSWTDEWHRGGHDIEDWHFGLTDRARNPKPALAAVRQAFAHAPVDPRAALPRVSVVICTYNGEATLGETCAAVAELDYPDFEVLVVDDGSTDASADIAAEHGFRVISTTNRGLSSARNTGLQAASGEIIAYLDDDAAPDPHWLIYLGDTFARTSFAAVGGPNLPVPDDGAVADAVAAAPGNPTHVLVSDREAEHIPGCNSAFRTDALRAIGGFDPRFRIAGDDVDVCWRLQERGWPIGFCAAAMVWHHRRGTVRGYLRQQRSYGRAEAMLERKWPERYSAGGHVTWRGRVYGDAAPRHAALADLPRGVGHRAVRVALRARARQPQHDPAHARGLPGHRRPGAARRPRGALDTALRAGSAARRGGRDARPAGRLRRRRRSLPEPGARAGATDGATGAHRPAAHRPATGASRGSSALRPHALAPGRRRRARAPGRAATRALERGVGGPDGVGAVVRALHPGKRRRGAARQRLRRLGPRGARRHAGRRPDGHRGRGARRRAARAPALPADPVPDGRRADHAPGRAVRGRGSRRRRGRRGDARNPGRRAGAALAERGLGGDGAGQRGARLRGRRGAVSGALDVTPAVGSFRRQGRLLRYAKPEWRGLLVLIATMLANIALDLLRPWPIKLVVDNVLGDAGLPHVLRSLPGVNGRHGLLVWVVVATLLIFLLGTVTNMAYTYFSLRLGQRMTYRLATDLFAHLQRLSLLFHTRRPVGDLISRVTGDSWCVNTLVADALVPALQAVVTVGAMFVVMWNLQPTLTLLALGVMPFFVVVIRVLGRPIKDRNREQRDLEGNMMSIVEQTLSAVPAVQAFTREDHETKRFSSYADRTVIAYVRATVAGLWFELFAGLVSTLGTAAVIYVGADLALRGKLTAGTIIVFLSYLGSLYDPLNSITHTAQTVQGAAAEADRVSEILETVPDIQDKPAAPPARVGGSIRYENVTFGYAPEREVLKDVTLEAHPGDVVAIVGPTGAGKTTLMNLLVRFYDPWSGRVTIDGVDLRDVQHRSLRQQIALVLQDPFILPLSIAENIAYGRPEATRAEVEAAARAANAHDFVTLLPQGYDTVVGERGATLSGGEKQRLSIARAFLKDAPVLVLDEPTSALDARTEGALLEALERLMDGRISFVIAHRLSTIRRATQILVIEHGQVIESGSHAELLDAGGLYSSLYRRQMDMAEHDAPREALIPDGHVES